MLVDSYYGTVNVSAIYFRLHQVCIYVFQSTFLLLGKNYFVENENVRVLFPSDRIW